MSEISSEITDAVTHSNVQVVAESPANGLGNVYLTASHATGLLFENAVGHQQQQFLLAQTGASRELHQLYQEKTITEAIRLAQLLQNEN
ncbi:MAG: RebB family R body protein [Salibacteraceae bacterium]